MLGKFKYKSLLQQIQKYFCFNDKFIFLFFRTMFKITAKLEKKNFLLTLTKVIKNYLAIAY